MYAVEGWGLGEVWADGTTLLAHDLPSPPRTPRPAPTHGRHDEDGDPEQAAPMGGARPPLGTLPWASPRDRATFVSNLCLRFACHLAGWRTGYDDVELDVSWCTPFQSELLSALRSVPWGEVVTYGELAALAGRPGAARAAGSFCAGNRFSLVVPCHRVVAATSLGGYGDAGVDVKRRLLRLEGVTL